MVSAAAAIVACLTAAAGGILTDIGPWYQALAQPVFKPPDWAFGPAWTLIFAFSAASGAWAWLRLDIMARGTLLALFGLNIVCNVGWSLLFFTLKRPDWALIEVAFLWASVLALIAFLWTRSRPSAWLLMPYLAWVSFAWAINYEVVRLNAPFSALTGG